MNARTLFIGSKKIGFLTLVELKALAPEALIGVLTVDDRTDSRSYFENFRDFCRSTKVPLIVGKSNIDIEKVVKELSPNLCIVCCWYRLIKPDLLASMPLGVYGIHNSLLPRYRGGAPLVWAMLSGEKTAGTTFFRFGSGMDDGYIVGQSSFSIHKNDYIEDCMKKAEDAAIRMVNKYYCNILKGRVRLKGQNHSDATYCAQRNPEDGEIDWSQHAETIYNFIRAQSNPYPGAFTWIGKEKITLWKVRHVKFISGSNRMSVGEIFKKANKGFVKLKDGFLEILYCKYGSEEGEFYDIADRNGLWGHLLNNDNNEVNNG